MRRSTQASDPLAQIQAMNKENDMAIERACHDIKEAFAAKKNALNNAYGHMMDDLSRERDALMRELQDKTAQAVTIDQECATLDVQVREITKKFENLKIHIKKMQSLQEELANEIEEPVVLEERSAAGGALAYVPMMVDDA